MQYDTREAPRIRVNLPARWEGVLEQRDATVTSLSLNGCFLLSGGEVKSKELLRLEIELTDGEPVYCWGEVVDQAYEIGFAVRFNALEEAEHERLANFISIHLDPA
jgi:hypothetical protein